MFKLNFLDHLHCFFKVQSASERAPMAEAILETLTSKGWRFRDSDEVLSLIPCKPSPVSVDSVESELLNMDLRSFGGKSLPDPSSLKKSSHLQGPKVLQVIELSPQFFLLFSSFFVDVICLVLISVGCFCKGCISKQHRCFLSNSRAPSSSSSIWSHRWAF